MNKNVFFGSYNDDKDYKSPIEWIVLDETPYSYFLISKKVIDTKEYNSSFVDITWEKCSLRD